MSSAQITILSIAFVGLCARLAVQRFEIRCIRWAWRALGAQGANAEDDRTTILKRTYTAISAARLGRVLSLAVLLPAIVLLAGENDADWAGGSGVGATVLRLLAAGVILLVFVLFLANAMMGSRDGEGAGEPPPPPWLTSFAVHTPAPVAAGAILWDWIVRSGELLLKRLSLGRPQAQLVEREGHFFLAVGEGEMGAIAPAQHGGASLDGSRTERDMIRAIQRLDETLVREVMRPLNAVTATPLMNLTAEKFLALARRTGFTRFPAYHDQITNMIGYLNVHDFLGAEDPPRDMQKQVHQVLYIPEIARLDVALEEMLRTRSQIAICVDEYGGCSGLLSREDIIEEITGEIMDEYDRPESKIREAHGAYTVDGATDLDDLREAIGLDLEKRHCDTIAGYIFQLLSRIPRRGEVIEEAGWRIEVLRVENHRVRLVRIEKPTTRDSATLPTP
ncbi:hypothetical protein BH09SUM1_BH09SUM1_26410 [soil metagenome]